MSIAVLIVAGGVGQRLGDDIPKQYQKIAGKTILNHTVACFLQNKNIDHICVVIHKDAEDLFKQEGFPDNIAYVFGGKERQDSVRIGLQSLRELNPDKVLIHDAARPFVSQEIINRVISGLNDSDAVIPIAEVTDTIKRISQNNIVETIDRHTLGYAQTPQGFSYKTILDLHVRAESMQFTDDAGLCEDFGVRVNVVAGDSSNIKITTKDDMKLARYRMENNNFRIGSGFDVHKFCEGHEVTICGVKIPHDKGLDGHSDADVGLHALVDALLGAIAQGDIGDHFPPDDDKWKDADSSVFVKYANELVQKHGGSIGNIDITIICEKPKISQYRDEMRKTVADLLGIDISQVSVKATTTERLGFLGRSEGIAAQASILLHHSTL